MNKQTFIQKAVIEWMPHLDWKAELAIKYAHRLWDVLYDGQQESDRGPRAGRDYYSALPEHERRRFDEFWIAFSYKHGKQGAARRWVEIDTLTDEEFSSLLMAAKSEAENRGARGTTPPMAALWLAERRWHDTVTHTTTDNSDEIRLRDLYSRLSHAIKMMEIDPSVAWSDEIEKINKEINAHGAT